MRFHIKSLLVGQYAHLDQNSPRSEELSSVQAGPEGSFLRAVTSLRDPLAAIDSEFDDIVILVQMEMTTGFTFVRLTRAKTEPMDKGYRKYVSNIQKSIKSYQNIQNKALDSCRKAQIKIKQNKIFLKQSQQAFRELNCFYFMNNCLRNTVEASLLDSKSRSLSEDTTTSRERQDIKHDSFEVFINKSAKPSTFWPSCQFQVD